MKFNSGPWLIEFTPEDGARLDRIAYNNYDLITTEPENFRKPNSNYGEYENRPVYGYDDCFPSVEPCQFPETGWKIPDHGELCWLNWNYLIDGNRLEFNTKSKALPVQFKREMIFSPAGITWNFEVINKGKKNIPFQHVMHPLMKLDEISSVHFPEFQTVYNLTVNRNLELKSSEKVQDFLLSQSKGSTNMLFLKKINDGKLSFTYKNGLLLKMLFPLKYFSSIGIWWNNSGYPDEEGIRRNECAFEPVPGLSSNLANEFRLGNYLEVLPNAKFEWKIIWELYS